jgi:hypothetical protein
MALVTRMWCDVLKRFWEMKEKFFECQTFPK